MSFKRLLEQHQGIALIDQDGSEMTYNQLCLKTDQINEELDQVNNNPLLIFILCQQNIATVLAITAVMRSHHVAFLIPETVDNSMLSKLIDIYLPNIIYHTDDTSQNIENLVNKPVALHPDLCFLLSTSGSTGTPKQVKISNSNLYENAKSIASYLEISKKDRAITSLPLSYSYGLSVLTSHLYAGASVLVSSASIMTRSFWQQIEQYQITGLTGVPYIYEIYKKLKLTDRELPSLKTLTQAGGKLAPELVTYFAEYAAKTSRRFFIMYGQTEATARMSYLPSDQVLKNPQSIGFEIPGGRFELIDNENKLITEANKEGELTYKGPNVMMGYANNRDDLASDEKLGSLHTGDLAYRDKEGRYYITGRKSRFIKVSGLRINLSDVEKFLLERGFDSACTGQDDALVIMIKSKDDPSEKVKHILHECLHIYPGLIHVKNTSSFPYNENGKKDYMKIYQQVTGELNNG